MSSIYSYNQETETVEVVSGSGKKKQFTTSKATALTFGYMAIGLVITSAVAYLVAWLLTYLWDSNIIKTDEGILWAYIGCLALGLIGAIITNVAMNHANKKGKSIIVHSILYCVFVGVMCCGVLLADIPYYIIGEAFGITAGVFLIMFLIGYFSKANFTGVAYVGMLLLFLLLGAFLFAFIGYAISGFQSSTFSSSLFWIDMLIYFVVCALLLVIVAIDAKRMKTILAQGTGDGTTQNNLILYCAMMMYGDFVMILIRVIYILAAARGSSN